VLAIWRDGSFLRANLQTPPLQAGDVLLIQAPRAKIQSLEASGELVMAADCTALFDDELREHLFTLYIPPDSYLDGSSLAESRLGDAYGVNVLSLLRDDQPHLMPDAEEKLQAGDTLLVEGEREKIAMMAAFQDLQIDRETAVGLAELESERVGLLEVLLSPQTTLVGKSLRETHFREKFGLNVLAIWRQGKVHRANLRDLPLRFGDVLLLHGPWARLTLLAHEDDFIVLSPEIRPAPRLKKAPVALFIMAGVVLAALFGWLPIALAAVIGGALMVVTGCLSMEEAYQTIDWQVVFLIAGMLPLGIALEKSGTARYLAQELIGVVGLWGPLAILGGLSLLTMLASQFMPNAVVAVLMAPIALNTALDMGLSPYAMMMSIAIAASTSFLSPVAHPTNILVMGPGNYRFSDYFRVGFPLTVIVLLITLLIVPVFWPLAPP